MDPDGSVGRWPPSCEALKSICVCECIVGNDSRADHCSLGTCLDRLLLDEYNHMFCRFDIVV